MPTPPPRTVPALKVHQWLPEWDKIDFDAAQFRRKPPDHFFLFTMKARELRSLCGIERRSASTGKARKTDLAIQRRHEPARSDEIAEFVRSGFPWSALTDERRKSGDFDDLKKPGWLPTAIVVNILRPADTSSGVAVHQKDVVSVKMAVADSIGAVSLPDGFDEKWSPTGAAPMTVIDGQHRLWAFENDDAPDFEVPVVAFVGLDVAWQAYLFYTVNIKPKKISASLAFDLYPLLRNADWLEKFEGHSVYRESRAQELTEALWSFPASPWHRRINMLGDPGQPYATQASWVRSLMATYVKSSEGKGVRVGGLFGSPVGSQQLTLPWHRAQQAAFLIYLWQQMNASLRKQKPPWLETLTSSMRPGTDATFGGRFSLINTDQGVRGLLAISNDLTSLLTDHLKLKDWQWEGPSDALSEAAVTGAINDLARQPAGKFLEQLCENLASYDWRTSGAPGLTLDQQERKGRFRGSSGYKQIRDDLLVHLAPLVKGEVLLAVAESRQW